MRLPRMTESLCDMGFRPPIKILNSDELQTLGLTDKEWNFVDEHDIRLHLYVLQEVHNVRKDFHIFTTYWKVIFGQA